MPDTFRCIGRVWPQADQEAKTRIIGRPPPMYWYMMYHDGAGIFEDFNHVGAPVLYRLRGGVLNPDQIWGSTWQRGNDNARIYTAVESRTHDGRPPFDFVSSFQALINGIGYNTAYRLEIATFYTVPTRGPYPPIVLPKDSDGGAGPAIGDATISWEVGTYARIPAGSCDGV